MNLQERLEQLQNQRAQLQLQIDELNFLIQGYENAIKQTEDAEESTL